MATLSPRCWGTNVGSVSAKKPETSLTLERTGGSFFPRLNAPAFAPGSQSSGSPTNGRRRRPVPDRLARHLGAAGTIGSEMVLRKLPGRRPSYRGPHRRTQDRDAACEPGRVGGAV